MKASRSIYPLMKTGIYGDADKTFHFYLPLLYGKKRLPLWRTKVCRAAASFFKLYNTRNNDIINQNVLLIRYRKKHYRQVKKWMER